MSHVTSKDGTSIAYERVGSGPAVILVGGGIDDGSERIEPSKVLPFAKEPHAQTSYRFTDPR